MKTPKGKWREERGATPVELGLLLGLTCLLIAGFILLLRKDSPDSKKDQVQKVVDYQLYLLDYRGGILHCIDMKPDAADGTLCDWDRFYYEHPELTRRPG